MVRNYAVIAIRNMRRRPGYSFINVLGLAIAISVCLLVLQHVRYELSYDRFHEHSDRIYRVLWERTTPRGVELGSQTPAPLAPALRETFPEVVRAVRWFQLRGVVSQDGRAFSERIHFADPEFFDVFSFGLKGDAAQRPDAVVLSESAARRFFGDADPAGMHLTIALDDARRQLSVAGVVREAAGPSSLSFDVLLPFDLLSEFRGGGATGEGSWRTLAPHTYVLLSSSASAGRLEAKLPAFVRAHVQDSNASLTVNLKMQPLADMHFAPGIFDLQPADVTRPEYLYVLTAVAAFILLLACINFVLLSLGSAAGRVREVGVRKVVGARRSQLMWQFWGEALLTAGLAVAAAAALAQLALPAFSDLTGRSLAQHPPSIPEAFLVLAGLAVVVSLLAGSYPAVFISRFPPAETLKGTHRPGGKSRLMSTLVVVQFVVSIVLITGTILMYHQLELLQRKQLGFDQEHVVRLEAPFGEGARLMERYRTALAAEPRVLQVSGSWERFGGGDGVGFHPAQITADGAGEDGTAFTFGVAPGILETLGIELMKGRTFAAGAEEASRGVIVNERLATALGWEDPVGRKISSPFRFDDAPVIGVVKDFHFQSLHHEVAPVVLYVGPPLSTIYVRLAPGNLHDAMAMLQEKWKSIAPDLPFVSQFLDDVVAQQYRSEVRWLQLIGYAAVFALLIACLGLFGLAALASAMRTKEIGIRKVLGATVAGILKLLTKEFLWLVGVAFVIASPVAYFAADRWLQDFAFRIELGPWIFALAGALVLAIAILTVSYQAGRAALADPVESLRYE